MLILKLYIYIVEVVYLNCWTRIIKMLDLLGNKNIGISGLILSSEFKEAL